MKILVRMVILLVFAAGANAADKVPAHQNIVIETTEGNIVLELDGKRAPITVAHILKLVDSGFFNGTIFHRVISGFMAQGGGYTQDLKRKESNETIANESGNGLENARGTIAMARLGAPHSANSQFFINAGDNLALDPQPDRWGYTVFGYVIEGMDVVDKIMKVKTGPAGSFSGDVPVVPIVITKMARVEYAD